MMEKDNYHTAFLQQKSVLLHTKQIRAESMRVVSSVVSKVL
jgi:hypothetical protein